VAETIRGGITSSVGMVPPLPSAATVKPSLLKTWSGSSCTVATSDPMLASVGPFVDAAVQSRPNEFNAAEPQSG
jgi:hypothetical protein